MATTQQLAQYIANVKVTPSGLVEWNNNSLQDVMSNGVYPLLVERGLMQVDTILDMQAIPGTETLSVVINNVGLFVYEASGVPDYVDTFPAAGGGIWSRLKVPAIQPALDDLTDVDITNPTNGQVLTYDAANQLWINGAAPTGVTDLSQLSDVTINTPADGNFLVYDGTGSTWENRMAVLSDISDVDVSGATNDQVLLYNSGTTNWEATSLAAVAYSGDWSDLNNIPTLDLSYVLGEGDTAAHRILLTEISTPSSDTGLQMYFLNDGVAYLSAFDNDEIQLSTTSSGGSNVASLGIKNSANSVFSSSGDYAIDYDTDPTSNFTGLSLVHKDYVDNLVASFIGLQGVTDAGNETTNTLVVSGKNQLASGDAIEMYFDISVGGFIQSNASGISSLYLVALNTNDSSYAHLSINTSSQSYFQSSNNFPIDYTNDPTANFTGMSLVHKDYVDNTLAAWDLEAVTDAGNTTTKGIVILDGSSPVTTDGMAFGFSSIVGGTIYSISDTPGANATLYLNAFNVTDSVGGSLIINSSSNSVFTSNGGFPIDYGTDYSANYTDRSLVDKEYVDGLLGTNINVRYSQVTSATVSNTTSEGSILGPGAGSLVIPANTFTSTTVGKAIRITGYGVLSDRGSGDTLTIRFVFGGGTVLSVVTVPNVSTDGYFNFECVIKYTEPSFAAWDVAGRVMYSNNAGSQQMYILHTQVVVSPTLNNTIDVRAEWNFADSDNSITCYYSTVELLNTPAYP
jgi:hypothetical protein